MLKSIAKEDPDLVKKVLQISKDEALGLTGTDRLIKQLGIANGERAKYIYETLKDQDDKKAYLKELARKKLLTSDVLTQIAELKSGDK